MSSVPPKLPHSSSSQVSLHCARATFSQLFVHLLQGCFWGVVSSTAVSVGVQLFLPHTDFASSGGVSRSRLLGCMVIVLALECGGTSVLFPTALTLAYIPMSHAGAFSLGISPAFVISCLVGSHLPAGEAVPRCDVTLLFSFEGSQTLALAPPYSVPG